MGDVTDTGNRLAPSRMNSRSRALDSGCRQLGPEHLEESVDSAIHVKRRGHIDQTRDLRRGAAVLEAQPQEQAVRGLEPLKRRVQHAGQLGPPDRVVGSTVISRRDLTDLHLRYDEVDEMTALAPPIVGWRRALGSAVAVPMFVDTQSTCDRDEPGCELPPTVGRELAQPTTVVGAERVEHERIAVHDCVALAAEATCGVQDQRAEPGQKCGPAAVSLAWIACGEEELERLRRRYPH